MYVSDNQITSTFVQYTLKQIDIHLQSKLQTACVFNQSSLDKPRHIFLKDPQFVGLRPMLTTFDFSLFWLVYPPFKFDGFIS